MARFAVCRTAPISRYATASQSACFNPRARSKWLARTRDPGVRPSGSRGFKKEFGSCFCAGSSRRRARTFARCFLRVRQDYQATDSRTARFTACVLRDRHKYVLLVCSALLRMWMFWHTSVMRSNGNDKRSVFNTPSRS